MNQPTFADLEYECAQDSAGAVSGMDGYRGDSWRVAFDHTMAGRGRHPGCRLLRCVQLFYNLSWDGRHAIRRVGEAIP